MAGQGTSSQSVHIISKMKRAATLLLIIISSTLIAQDAVRKQAAVDFSNVNETYSSTPLLKMNVSYALFPSYTSTAAFEKSSGVFMKNGNDTYSNLLGIVSISNRNVSVTLDSNEKVIVVANPPSRKKQSPSLIDVDTMLSQCSGIEYKELEGGLKYYKLRFDGIPFSEYNAVEIYIDGKTNFISRLMLYYRVEIDLDEEGPACSKDRPRLEIVYTNVDTRPVFPQDQFSESKMIRASGKTYIAAPAYSKYRVINNKIR